MISTWTQAPDNYGVLNEGDMLGRFTGCLMKAAEVFSAKSGKFVKADGTDDFAVAGSGDTQITGWAVVSPRTIPASTIPTYAEVITDANARFLIPADAAVTAAVRGLTCDLITAANIQRADIGESNEDVLVIYDVNVALTLCEVGLNPAKMWAAGVV